MDRGEGKAMGEIPALGRQDTRAVVGDAGYARGERYFRDGAIYDARRQGATLKARCEGSYDNAYRVEVAFDKNGIKSASCSCPVGAFCKHVAALLLTWLDRPGDFATLEDLDVSLQSRTKDELIALVKQMLRQEPDLETLLHTPLPGVGALTPDGRPAPVDPEVYRRQAEAAFRSTRSRRSSRYDDDGGWLDEGEIADKLDALLSLGDGFERQGDYANAAAVYEAVSSTVLDRYEEYNVQDELAGTVVACVEGLGRCLAGEPAGSPARESILPALVAVYQLDRRLGGTGLSDGIPDLLVERTTPEERVTVADQVRDALSRATGPYNSWTRQAYGDLLLALEEDGMDDETYLRICRETGRTNDLLDRLLTLGRLDEAMAATEGVDDYPLLRLVDHFVQHGHNATAEAIVRERADKTQDPRVLEWLKNRYAVRGDLAAALDVAVKVFRMQPTLERYQEARALATRRDRWEPLRPRLRMFLREAKHDHLLLRIYLDEGEIDNALAALKDAKPGYSPYYDWSHSVRLEVARRAEDTHPYAAIDIYQKQAEHLIGLRGRPNYNAAAALLARIKALYERLDKGEAWQDYIKGLREKNTSLRALKEELAAAGL